MPYGAVASYQGIAETIGKTKAVRAVAQALHYNPVPIQIPCHRVIGSNGNLTGYTGDRVGIKKHLLEIEGGKHKRFRHSEKAHGGRLEAQSPVLPPGLLHVEGSMCRRSSFYLLSGLCRRNGLPTL